MPSLNAPSAEGLQSCVEEKQAYEKCFSNWYRHHFLKGHTEDVCADSFATYRQCLQAELKAKDLLYIPSWRAAEAAPEDGRPTGISPPS